MAKRSRLLFLSALLATAMALPDDGWAQRGRGGGGGSVGRSSGGSVGRSSGGSIGRSSGGSIGRSSGYSGRSTPAPSRPSGRSIGRGSPRVSPTPRVTSPRVTSPRVSSPRVTPTPSTGRSARTAPTTSPYTPRVDAGRSSSGWRGSVDRGTSIDTGLRTPSYDSPLRGADTGSGGLSSGRLGRTPDLGSAGGYDSGLRSRPTTSTATSTRGVSPVVDIGRSAAPRQQRTPFPSMYRPAPETLSGARITAMERLESQRAQRRVAGQAPSLDGRAGARSIADRYSRDSGATRAGSPGTDAARTGRDPFAGLSGSRASTLSRARLDGLSRHRDSARETTRAAGASTADVGRTARATSADRSDPRAAARDARARYDRARSQDREVSRRTQQMARAGAIASDAAFRTALRATKLVPGVPGVPSTSGGWSNDVAVGNGYTGDYGYYGYNTCNWYWSSWYPSFCWGWWGSGWWWGACWGWGGGWYSPWRCSWGYPFSYWYPYYGYYYPYYYPTYYAYSAPAVYQAVYYDDQYYGQEYADPGYAVEQPAAEPAAPVQAAPRADANALMGRATAEYLNLGDRAFSEGDYGKAVKYYAKAVEYSPNDGVLYLVLSDALFATGDYHYAAYALRRALELAPDLAQVVIDKRQFYGSPSDFDQQLAQLETYLNDHFLDDDARLLLAANYLFGAMPEKCVELLENPFSTEVKESATGQLILAAAQGALAAKD